MTGRSQVEIRKATPTDVDALMALSRRTIDRRYRAFLGDQAVDTYLGSGELERYVTSCVPTCMVLERAGRVMGYAVWQDDLLDVLMIDHHSQHQGLGGLLLASVEQAMFASHDELRLESFAENTAANTFYRANGWKAADRIHDEQSGAEKMVFVKRR